MTPETVQEMYAAMKADPDGDGEPRLLCRAVYPGRLLPPPGRPNPYPGDRPEGGSWRPVPVASGSLGAGSGLLAGRGRGESEGTVMPA